MQRRTTWTFGFFIGVYIVSTLSLGVGAIYSTHMRQTIVRRHEAVIKDAQIIATMAEAESSARAFLISGDVKDLRGLESAKLTWRDQVSALTSRLAETQTYSVDKLAPLLEQQLQDLTRIIELKRTNSSRAFAEIVKHSDLPVISQSRAILSSISEGEGSFVRQMARTMDDRMKTRLPLLVGTGFLALFLLGIALKRLRAELKHRNKAQEEFKKSEERLRLTLGSAQLAIWDMDAETGEGHWDGAAAELYGVSDTTEISSRVKSREFIHEGDREKVKACFDEALKTGTYHDIEFRIQRKNGEVRWVHSWAKVVKRLDGRPQRVIGALLDISEKKAAQETIERQQKSIVYAAKMAALGEMAGGIAHEINNPLAIIAGQAQLCQDLIEAGEASEEQLVKSLGKIRHWVAHTAKVIFGLRQFSRDGTQDPFQVTSVNDIFEKTLDLCRETFARRGVRLETEILSDDIQIECRSVQISQVLLNLLQNALHAAEAMEDRWVKLTVESTVEEIIFRVLDSGVGVPVEIREKVMQPFFTTKETARGTGLGLSISKGLIESHQGEIYLDTEAPHTCFVVKLPRNAKEGSSGGRDVAGHSDEELRIEETELI